MNPVDKMVQTLQLVLIALVGIAFVWLITDQLVQNFGFPAWLKILLVGIAVAYIYYTRDEILEMFKK